MLGFLKLKKNQNYLFVSVYLLTVIYVSYNILYEANWTFGDNLELWRTTAGGKWKELSAQIIPHLTRFNPLAFYDYNLLLFTPYYANALAYYIYVTLTFLLFSICFIILLKKIADSFTYAWSLLIGILYFIIFIFNYGSLVLFLDIIYPDRMVLVALSFFALCYYNAIKSDSTIYYICALFCAVIATYNKEPVFGIFVVIALTNISFYLKVLSRKHILFNIALIINGLIFTGLFYVFVYSIKTGSYLELNNEVSYFSIFFMQVNTNRIIACATILSCFRMYSLLFKTKNIKNLFYDVTLLAGLAYAIAFVILKLPTFYYTIPAYFLMLPSLMYWTLKSYVVKKTLPLLITIGLIVFCNVSWLELKQIFDMVHYRRQNEFIYLEKLAQKYKEGYQFVFIEEFLNDEDGSRNIQLRNYHRDIAVLAFNFILGEENSSNDYFVYDDDLDEYELDDKIVVFYSDFNLSGSKKQMDSATEKKLTNFSHTTKLLSLSVFYPKVETLKELISNNYSLNTGNYFHEIVLFDAGWSAQEDWGRWTDSANASLVMKVAPGVKGVKLVVSHMFIPANETLDMTILVNGIEVLSESYTQPISEIDIPLPQEVVNNLANDNIINIELQMPNVKSPKELGLSDDSRKLGVGLKEVKIY